MESPGFAQACPVCRREFSHLGAFSHHLKNCKSKKTRITSALAAARQFYQQTKKRRLDARDAQNRDPKPVLNTGVSSSSPTSDSLAVNATSSSGSDSNHVTMDNLDQIDDRPIAERRPRRNIRMPARFLDQEPTGQAALPPVSTPEPPSRPTSQSRGQQLCFSLRNILKSPRNVFGLFCQYRAEKFPSHDPNAGLEPVEHSDVLSDALNTPNPNSVPSSAFHPYPNENAFLLGEWFWDDSLQKSKSSFNKLINIVSRPEFKPEDVKKIPWDSINEQLGSLSDGDEAWLDEPDAGWTETPITISVPFHRLTSNPGPQIYTTLTPSFRHRNIVSILKEKMANVEDF
jgi:hypothetical protein